MRFRNELIPGIFETHALSDTVANESMSPYCLSQSTGKLIVSSKTGIQMGQPLDKALTAGYSHSGGFAPYNHITIGATNMSFLCIYPCTDGLVLASDTRRTFTSENGEVVFFDDEQKVFPIEGTNIYVAGLGLSRFGPKNKESYASILPHIKSKTREGIANEIGRVLLDYGVNDNSLVILAEPIKEHKTVKIAETSLHMDKGIASITTTQLTQGVPSFAGNNWATEIASNFVSHKCNVQEGQVLARAMVDAMIRIFALFEHKKQVIGGEVDVQAIMI